MNKSIKTTQNQRRQIRLTSIFSFFKLLDHRVLAKIVNLESSMILKIIFKPDGQVFPS